MLFDLLVGKLKLFTTLNGGNKFSVGSFRPTYLLVSVKCKFLFEVEVKVATTQRHYSMHGKFPTLTYY